jgi:hypothetical protein
MQCVDPDLERKDCEMPLVLRDPIDKKALDKFLSQIDFKFPIGYLEFMSASNGAEGMLKNSYLILWPIEDLIQANQEYYVDEFAPGFFIIGSNGGGMAFAIDKEKGALYEMPFIGMSRDEAEFRADDFEGFIASLES